MILHHDYKVHQKLPQRNGLLQARLWSKLFSCPVNSNFSYLDLGLMNTKNKSFKFLIENKFFGNKSGKGYYEKTKEKDENGIDGP